MTEAVIVSGVRTAIGNFGGSLQDTPVVKLGSIVIKEALKRVGLRPRVSSEVLSYAPEVLRDMGVIELEEKFQDWDESIQEVDVDEQAQRIHPHRVAGGHRDHRDTRIDGLSCVRAGERVRAQGGVSEQCEEHRPRLPDVPGGQQ